MLEALSPSTVAAAAGPSGISTLSWTLSVLDSRSSRKAAKRAHKTLALAAMCPSPASTDAPPCPSPLFLMSAIELAAFVWGYMESGASKEGSSGGDARLWDAIAARVIELVRNRSFEAVGEEEEGQNAIDDLAFLAWALSNAWHDGQVRGRER